MTSYFFIIIFFFSEKNLLLINFLFQFMIKFEFQFILILLLHEQLILSFCFTEKAYIMKNCIMNVKITHQ